MPNDAVKAGDFQRITELAKKPLQGNVLIDDLNSIKIGSFFAPIFYFYSYFCFHLPDMQIA